ALHIELNVSFWTVTHPTYSPFPQPFFFSSRRRHTRFSRDWSSDVCSSDLTARAFFPGWRGRSEKMRTRQSSRRCFNGSKRRLTRSEERRVGKEGRDGGSPSHQQKEGETGQ